MEADSLTDDELAARLARGQLAILPTDTIYGLSGDARDTALVERINAIKGRSQPATIIPHDLRWARALVTPSLRALFDTEMQTRRGQTLLFPFAPDEGLELPAPALTASGLIALRWPRHFISEIARDAVTPLVTTSVNRTTEPFMTSLDDLDPAIREAVDIFVYRGPLRARPSTMVFFDSDPPRIVER